MTDVAPALPEYSPPSDIPDYAPSSDAPVYSAALLPQEQCLAISGNPRRTQISSFMKQTKNGGISLCLNNMDGPESTYPTFGRHDVIEGVVTLRDWENVASVQVKIEGVSHLETYTSFSGPWEGGIDETLMSESIQLWNQDPQNPSPPPLLRFSFPHPSTYRDGATTNSLPPSFFINFPGLIGLTASVTYTITVTAQYLKRKGLHNALTLSTPYTYFPRTRPRQPTLQGQSAFLSTVKSSPEEWVHFDCTMVSRTRKRQPIKCNFILPRIRTFPLERAIPFHIQVFSASTNLAWLKPEESPQFGLRSLFRFASPSKRTIKLKNSYIPIPTDGSATVTRGDGAPASADPSPQVTQNEKTTTTGKSGAYKPMRVYLLRQIVVEVRGQSLTETRLYGEGALKRAGEHPGWLAWEGEVMPSKDLLVGGFKIKGLSVKDFIVLSIDAPNADLSPLQYAVPIRYATDPFESETDVGYRVGV